MPQRPPEKFLEMLKQDFYGPNNPTSI